MTTKDGSFVKPFDPEDKKGIAEYKRQVGLRIATKRKEKGMTQATLAESVGMNPKMISRVENGTGNCRTWEINAIADALGVSLNYLLRGATGMYRYFEIGELLRQLTDEQLIRSKLMLEAAFMELLPAS